MKNKRIELSDWEKFICINNLPKIYNDGSSDDANQYLTIGKVYDGRIDKIQGLQLYIEVSDRGGFPYGHRWWHAERFRKLEEMRDSRLSELGI